VCWRVSSDEQLEARDGGVSSKSDDSLCRKAGGGRTVVRRILEDVQELLLLGE
jgi:hypothetical protein